MRSKWKLSYTFNNLQKKKTNNTRKYLFLRSHSITLFDIHFFKQRYLLIHNGKTYKRVYLKPYMIGFKYGQLIKTKKKIIHKKKKKNKWDIL